MKDEPMYENIRVGGEPRLGRITLDRPERRNALSLAMIGDVTTALRELATDEAVQVIIIEGAGQAFCAGHDMRELIDREPAVYAELFGSSTVMMETIHDVPQPVIAKVHGVATAAGCQLAAACDLVVAASDARFATPGVQIGLFCSTPMVPISRAVGRKRAMEMLLTGESITAPTAQEWGLVNRVVQPEELETATMELVDQITRYSPAVIGIGKKAFYTQIELSEHGAYRHAGPVMSANAAMDEAQEGMGAFLEKRRPVWPDTDPQPAMRESAG